MSSTGFRNSLPSTLVECMLEILQSSALSQVGQARLLQGPGLRGFSNDRSVKCIHVTAAKLFPLVRREGLGAVLLVDTRRIAPAITTVIAGEARRTARSVDHQDFRRGVTAVTLGCSLDGVSRQVEQAVESFVGIDCRDLWGGRLECLHRRVAGSEDATRADRY